MTAILEAEATRLAEQSRLDRLKTARERNQRGQFATPPALSLEIALNVRDRFRHYRGGFRFLDPAIGTGSFFGAFLRVFPVHRIEIATGIELDPQFASAARAIWCRQGLQVIHGDFTQEEPASLYNVILANPPYVRHHHLTTKDKRRLGELAYKATGLRLNGLAGLYCYFLLIAHAWLAEEGIGAWLIPSEFMDVNYGNEVKRYLTERVSLLQIHRFCPEDVQFGDALVSSAVVVFQKCAAKPGHEVVVSFGGSLAQPSRTEKIVLDRLRVMRKWTVSPKRHGNGHGSKIVTLGDFFTVKRGLATGSNGFFILPRAKLQELGIPESCVRPILPSPRYLKQEFIEADAEGWPLLDSQLALIDCSLGEEEICRKWPRFAEYLKSGKERGIHEGYLTSRRSPWYSQEKRDFSPLVCTYMGRSQERPFRFILNRSQATVANAYHLLYPKAHVTHFFPEKIEEVFNALREIHPEHFLSQGRVYGGGLYKMEPAEMMRLPADGLAQILGADSKQQKILFQKCL